MGVCGHRLVDAHALQSVTRLQMHGSSTRPYHPTCESPSIPCHPTSIHPYWSISPNTERTGAAATDWMRFRSRLACTEYLAIDHITTPITIPTTTNKGVIHATTRRMDRMPTVLIVNVSMLVMMVLSMTPMSLL